LRPIIYLAFAIRALIYDTSIAQTKNPSEYFNVYFGSLATENIPASLDFHYWLDKLDKTDNLALLSIEFESIMKDVTTDKRTKAEEN